MKSVGVSSGLKTCSLTTKNTNTLLHRTPGTVSPIRRRVQGRVPRHRTAGKKAAAVRRRHRRTAAALQRLRPRKNPRDPRLRPQLNRTRS